MIPDSEIERIKQTTDLAALVRSRGVELHGGGGGNLIGRCPFHDDEKPSFVVTPAKGLFRCMSPACGATGNAIQFIMRKDGISFRHAVELLRAPSAAAFSATPKTVRVLPAPVSFDADDKTLLGQVVDFYHERLVDESAGRAAREYLARRGLGGAEALRAHWIGYADRSLGLRLPNKQRVAGADIRARLTRLGIYRESGHEHFTGCVVMPILDEAGNVAGIYGRKIVKQDTGVYHLYLAGAHRGFWNRDALQSREVILCEALLDALTFWENGFRNVTAAYGVEGFTAEMEDAFAAAKLERVYLAFDRDAAGDAGARKVAARLMARGIECRRVLFPYGQDANDYARKTTPANKAFAVLLNAAEFIGRGSQGRGEGKGEVSADVAAVAEKMPEVSADVAAADVAAAALPPRASASAFSFLAAQAALVADAPTATPAQQDAAKEKNGVQLKTPATPAPAPDTVPPAVQGAAPLPSAVFSAPRDAAKEKNENNFALPATTARALDRVTTPPAVQGAAPLPPATSSAPPSPDEVAPVVSMNGDEAALRFASREWLARGLLKNAGLDALKVTLRLTCPDGMHVDALDMTRDAERRRFVERAAEETRLHPDLLRREIGRVLLALERLQAARLRAQAQAADTTKTAAPQMSAREREDALALLRDPKLLNRILRDFAACGVVGEETNKLTGYLAAVSRKLATPLAVIVQSTSAAGKTALMEAVLAFMPPEERVKYSALTGQALYYMADADLKHKILAIVEEEGAEKASYALKLLQSEGELTIASTGKDPHTGRMETQEYRVEGPVMIFLTTTAVDIDEELLNRCLVLTVDEGRKQTESIHELQREGDTLEGILETETRARILAAHRAAQRLLRPLRVVNPFARKLTFMSDRTRARRDHTKYLALIRVIALLHQHQREIKTVEHEGRRLEYIEATIDDIAAANRLAHEVLGRCLDEMPPQTRRLLVLLETMVRDRCKAAKMERGDVRFSRRTVREHTGWGDTQLKIHMGRLADMEYLIVHRAEHGGSGFVYELAYDGGGKDGRRFLSGLIDVEKLRAATATPPNRAGQNGRQSGVNGGRSGAGRPPVGSRTAGGRPEKNGAAPSDAADKPAPDGKNAHQDGAGAGGVDADGETGGTAGAEEGARDA